MSSFEDYREAAREPGRQVEQKRFVMQTEERLAVNTIPPWGTYYQDFIDQGTVPVNAGVGATPVFTMRQFQVPSQRRCVVRYLGIEPNDPAALPFIRFAFLVNGSIHRNYQNPPVLLGSIDDPALIYVELESDNTFALVFSNIGGAQGFVVFSRLVCWWWDPLAYDPGRYSPEMER